MDSDNVKSFWRYVKSRRKENTGIQPLKVQGKVLTDDLDKAKALANQFDSIFTREDGEMTPKPSMKGNPVSEMPPIIVTEEGVRKLLHNINVAKAIGPDNIPNQGLKLAADEIARVLQHYIPAFARHRGITIRLEKGKYHTNLQERAIYWPSKLPTGVPNLYLLQAPRAYHR